MNVVSMSLADFETAVVGQQQVGDATASSLNEDAQNGVRLFALAVMIYCKENNLSSVNSTVLQEVAGIMAFPNEDVINTPVQQGYQYAVRILTAGSASITPPRPR